MFDLFKTRWASLGPLAYKSCLEVLNFEIGYASTKIRLNQRKKSYSISIQTYPFPFKKFRWSSCSDSEPSEHWLKFSRLFRTLSKSLFENWRSFRFRKKKASYFMMSNRQLLSPTKQIGYPNGIRIAFSVKWVVYFWKINN